MQKGAQIRRGMIAALAVAAVAGAVHLAKRPGGELQSAAPASSDASRPGAAPKSANLAELIAAPRPALSREARADLFAPPRPDPAPAKTVSAVASKPEVPPFPYRYGGWVAVGSDAHRLYYLQKGNQVFAVNKGEMLDEVWRVDAVNEDRIEVSFVPLGQQLSLSLASLTGEHAPQGSQSAALGGASASGESASTGAAPARPLSRTPLASAASQPATTTAPPPAGPVMGAPLTEDPRPSRAGVAGAAKSAATLPQNASAGPGSSSTVPTGRLGVDAPSSGSMPTGPASLAPTGKLGL